MGSLGKYEILSELGRGGMGVVYLAHDPDLNRKVAIKVLSGAIAGDEILLARFRREARAAASLNHPNVIQIYSIEDHAGQVFFVMEYVEGLSLSQYLRQSGRLGPQEAAGILLQAAQGVAAAHERQIIHRDIKPANIMINQLGLVKVTDFGIAWAPDTESKLTATGFVIGTPGYIPPEVCIGQPTDIRSDIFSLGIVYFEMLAGRVPFSANSPLAMMQQVVSAEIPDIRQINDQVDEESYRILGLMVRKKREERFPNCQALIEALEQGPARGYKISGLSVILGQRGETTAAPTPLPAAENQTTELIAPNPQFEDETVKNPVLPPEAKRPPQKAQGEKKKSALLPVMLLLIMGLFLIGAVGVGWYLLKPDIMGDQDEKHQDNNSLVSDGRSGNDVSLPENQPDLEDQSNTLLTRNEELENSSESTGPQRDEAAAGQFETGKSPISAGDGENRANPLESSSVPGTDEKLNIRTQGLQADSPDDARLGGTIKIPEPNQNQTENQTIQRPMVSATPEYHGNPRVAVVAVGDQDLAGPGSRALIEFLSVDSLQMVDTDLIQLPENPTIASLIDPLGQGGADVLVFLKVTYLGNRQLRFGGRSETAIQSRLEVSCYRLKDKKKLGKTWSEEVEYTGLNAKLKVENALRPLSNEISETILQN